MISLANNKNATPEGVALQTQLKRSAKLVAGARNHHYLLSRGSCGVEVAGLAHSILKALTVEDSSNHLKMLWQAVA